MSTEMSDEMTKNGYLWQHFFNIWLIFKSFYQRWNHWRESVNRQDFVMVKQLGYDALGSTRYVFNAVVKISLNKTLNKDICILVYPYILLKYECIPQPLSSPMSCVKINFCGANLYGRYLNSQAYIMQPLSMEAICWVVKGPRFVI